MTASAPGTVVPVDEIGVGARLSLAVMADDYADVILAAVACVESADLTIQTDDVSTLVRGSEQRIAEYLTAVIASAARSGHHVSAHVLLSRGCPGEVECELPVQTLERVDPPHLDPVGVQATAQWSLYPLADTPTIPGVDPDHMRDIYAAIEQARERGTFAAVENFVTRLDGDLAEILATMAAGWVLAGRSVQHVTSHAVLSLNSPTQRVSEVGASGSSPGR